MINAFKLAGASAALAAVFMVAVEASKAEGIRTAAVAPERPTAAPVRPSAAPAEPVVTKASADGASGDCRGQTWPYVDRGCIAATGEPARKPVRTIAIERREAPGTADPVPVPFHPGR